MLSSLFYRIRIWPPFRWLADLWQRMRNRWYMWENGNYRVFTRFALGIVLAGSAVYFVYADHLRISWAHQRFLDLMCHARKV